MRALAVLALLSLTLLALPAAADQEYVAGPASLRTASNDADPCGDGSGYQQRSIVAAVEANEHQRLQAAMSNYCSQWSHDWSTATYGGLGVMAGRCGDWGCGPYASYDWFYVEEQYSFGGGYKSCTSTLYLSGLGLSLGCPSPDGSPPPMLPPL